LTVLWYLLIDFSLSFVHVLEDMPWALNQKIDGKSGGGAGSVQTLLGLDTTLAPLDTAMFLDGGGCSNSKSKPALTIRYRPAN
jgi:hypothetical protein